MNEPPLFVKNATLLLSRYGAWPEFHDAEVMRVELDSEGCILSLRLKVFQIVNELDEQGYYKRSNQNLVTFRFSGIEELTLADFNDQNSIFSLLFEKEDARIKITIEPSYGLRGAFYCREAEVTAVVSCH